jgi:hypothetical protein
MNVYLNMKHLLHVTGFFLKEHLLYLKAFLK